LLPNWAGKAEVMGLDPARDLGVLALKKILAAASYD
jgi:hypothetical protein